MYVIRRWIPKVITIHPVWNMNEQNFIIYALVVSLWTKNVNLLALIEKKRISTTAGFIQKSGPIWYLSQLASEDLELHHRYVPVYIWVMGFAKKILTLVLSLSTIFMVPGV